MTGKRNYSRTIVDRIKMFLDANEWKYSFDADAGVFRLGVHISEGCMLDSVNVYLAVKETSICTYALFPIQAPFKDAEVMARLAEFICRSNYNLKQGCLEVDYQDGELRYRCYIDSEGIIFSDEVIANSIYCSTAMLENFSYGLIGIIFRNMSAVEAVKTCELARMRIYLKRKGVEEEEAERLLAECKRRMDAAEAGAEETVADLDNNSVANDKDAK